MSLLANIYPRCVTDQPHKFQAGFPPVGSYGSTFVYCVNCGLTPVQLTDIKTAWTKAGIHE